MIIARGNNMISELRKKYLKLLGEIYVEYGFPEIVGWIDGIIAIESKPLTQSEISKKLSNIINRDDAFTSVSSVNRAIKYLEAYGAIRKKGNRKIGYKYSSNEETLFIGGFLQNFIIMH